MKKKLFLGLLAAAAVSFTACQKDEVISEMPQDNAIGFGTYVGRDAMTKATSINDATSLQNASATYGFGVFAYYTGSKNWDNATEAEKKLNFFINQNVYWQTNAWKYDNTKYWPGADANNQISFFAYAPHSGNGISDIPTNGATGNPTITYSVNTNVTNQIDLLVANPIKDEFYDKKSNGGTVKFEFNHVLSRIAFKVKTSDVCKIDITDINIKGNFYTSGTCNLVTGDFDNQTTTSNQIYTLSDYNTNAKGITGSTGKVINANNEYIMVIPNSSQTYTINVTYNYQYLYDGTNWSTPVNGITGRGEVTTEFIKGNAYNLVLNLNPLKPIEFNVDVDNFGTWGDPSDVGVENR